MRNGESSALRQAAFDEAAVVFGDLHPLAERIGTTAGLTGLSTAARSFDMPAVHDEPTLAAFLAHYRDQILVDVELPTIFQAYVRSASSGSRELLSLDRALQENGGMRDFGRASELAGKAELARLRGLKDERVLQRYLQAVEAGEAAGWHTIVFGLVMAIYSLPLRQGLLHYAQQTLRSLSRSASGPLRLSEETWERLAAEALGPVPGAVEKLVNHAAPQI